MCLQISDAQLSFFVLYKLSGSFLSFFFHFSLSVLLSSFYAAFNWRVYSLYSVNASAHNTVYICMSFLICCLHKI